MAKRAKKVHKAGSKNGNGRKVTSKTGKTYEKRAGKWVKVSSYSVKGYKRSGPKRRKK